MLVAASALVVCSATTAFAAEPEQAPDTREQPSPEVVPMPTAPETPDADQPAAPDAGGPCVGTSQVYWSFDSTSLLNYFGHYRILWQCYLDPQVTAYLIDCSTRLIFAGQATGPTAGSYGAEYCAAEKRSTYSYLAGAPLQKSLEVIIEIVPSNPQQPIVWGPNTTFCTGAGTTIARCKDDWTVFSGTGATRNYQ
jgi:hypothetical protein